MTDGTKGTQPSGSIKGLKEGQWYEIVISQEKQLVLKNKLLKNGDQKNYDFAGWLLL